MANPSQIKLDLFGQVEAHAPEAYPWQDGLIFDYFAGGGGASTGLAQGLGRSPDYAINHNKKALAMHEANHPDTIHLHEDVWHVDPRAVAAGRPVLFVHGSPDCTDFSGAKGGKPVRKRIRGLAWVLHRFAGTVLPAIMTLENVPEFETWGPLIALRDGYRNKLGQWVKKVGGREVPATGRVVKIDGMVAEPGEHVPYQQQQLVRDPKRKGQTFRAFVKGLRDKGYAVEWRVLTACDYGAPTSRRRLFLIARRDGLPVVWPEPSHGDPKSPEVKAGTRKPWRTAGEIIDWANPAPSIFDRKKPLADATLRRVANGVMKYVVDAGDSAFVVCLTHGARAESVEEPLRTITGAHRGERGIVVPSLMSIDHQSATSANRAASDPLSTVTHKARHAIIVPTMVQTGYGEREGQAPRVPGQEKPLGTIVGSQKHALVSAFLAKNYTGVVGSDLAGPIHTITATDHHAVVASHLVRLKANGRQGQGLDEPIGSIQAQGNHWAQVEAFLVKYYGSGVDASLEEPLDTITGKPRFGLVVIHGVEYQIVDIGFRMLEPGELFKGQGFPDDYEHQHVIIDGEPVTLTKSDQVAACGNSVPPDFVRALVEANVPRYALRRRDEAVAA